MGGKEGKDSAEKDGVKEMEQKEEEHRERWGARAKVKDKGRKAWTRSVFQMIGTGGENEWQALADWNRGRNSLARQGQDEGQSWMRRLCPLTIKESPSHIESPISSALPTSSCFSFISLSTMSSPQIFPLHRHRCVFAFLPSVYRLYRFRWIKKLYHSIFKDWTIIFDGHLCTTEGGRWSHIVGTGVSNRWERRRRDIVHLLITRFTTFLMHAHRSHLYDFDVSSMAPLASFHAYQKMIQDQLVHENKLHDRHFWSLKIVVPRKVHDKDNESGCLYFWCHDDEDAAERTSADEDDDDAARCASAGDRPSFSVKCEMVSGIGVGVGGHVIANRNNNNNNDDDVNDNHNKSSTSVSGMVGIVEGSEPEDGTHVGNRAWGRARSLLILMPRFISRSQV